MERSSRCTRYSWMVSSRPKSKETHKIQKGAKLSFSDKFYGTSYLIPWRFYGGFAYAAKDILTGISKEELVQQGFVTSKKNIK